ncbi:MAG: carbamoyl phosphate synthase large subunit [Acidobacteria bacterium 13_1_40CM_4_61_5]|nr:MAG: carbamoyl phosphate synthase large subunit [Acidobacteria bacterium 13_1_40CM_4_61_5]PYU07925.1 MAG: carbamoyl phosphate synthase large subunit [Acidobacteriota bacterium]
MRKRKDFEKILIIGSGPIVIGQACEFDYSGAQACKALRAEGYKVILVNSNPATIMTDPELAHRTYIEPLTKEYLAEIIAREKPDALLPTVGGQTALNLAVELAESGVLEKHKVELIGASLRAIKVAEDRLWFKDACRKIGLEVPASALVNNAQDAMRLCDQLGFPLVIRPSFTLGGTGGSIAYNKEEFGEATAHALDLSPVHEALVEESVLGWKEYELEVMRDFRDNFVVICSIENFDPMGVHTGDSITVAPAQTLTDKEYQRMRDAAAAIMREVGVETGGSNVQFAVNPENGRMVVIEMNPRVSRSSALASKATGFPIAKIAARLAVGMTLDEIPNDITKKTPACFEPTIDYVVVKIPKWQFEKFPGADTTLGTQMKSVGEVMAIGRTFKESLQKGIRSLEPHAPWRAPAEAPASLLREKLATPRPDRIHWLLVALERGLPAEEVCELTKIDPWFIHQLQEIVAMNKRAAGVTVETASRDLLREVKRHGASDEQLAQIWKTTPAAVRLQRARWNVAPVFKRVDTCAAEFESFTPYMYSTYEEEDEADPQAKPKIMILGSGPNRIGQGIEFDYCCCHASFALHEDGYETIMVNCNPETVSTDYDTSDRLYFEPLTLEDVLAIVEREKPQGVIVQFGGQTPLNLAVELKRNGVPIIGTAPESIDLAEDRRRFGRLLEELRIPQPRNATALVPEEAARLAGEIGLPVLVRPSYVLGGRAMVIAYDVNTVQEYVAQAALMGPAKPVLIDQFLEEATEVDVDALADGTDVVIGGIMEHIEEAGVHSGDSSCVLPPVSLSPLVLDTIREYTKRLALALKVVGLMNVQYAIQHEHVYVLEVNPRASRTVPYVSKATGVPLAKAAARLMVGRKLAEMDLPLVRANGVAEIAVHEFYSVKSPVFPFDKFRGVDTILGPEMRSTGEVMGISTTFGQAFAKAQLAAGQRLPRGGTVFISVNDGDKRHIGSVGKELAELGFRIVATRGTAAALQTAGVESEAVFKVNEGRPNIVDLVKTGKIDLIVNTPLGRESFYDEKSIRRAAIRYHIPCITTLSAAHAAARGIHALLEQGSEVAALQDLHRGRVPAQGGTAAGV